MNVYVKIIDNCLDCQSCKIDRIYTEDSWDHEEGAYCTECIKNGKPKLIVSDDWDLRKYSQVPSWCPKRLNNNIAALLKKSGIKSVDDFNKELKGLLKYQNNSFSELIAELVSKGFAYENLKKGDKDGRN